MAQIKLTHSAHGEHMMCTRVYTLVQTSLYLSGYFDAQPETTPIDFLSQPTVEHRNVGVILDNECVVLLCILANTVTCIWKAKTFDL